MSDAEARILVQPSVVKHLTNSCSCPGNVSIWIGHTLPHIQPKSSLLQMKVITDYSIYNEHRESYLFFIASKEWTHAKRKSFEKKYTIPLIIFYSSDNTIQIMSAHSYCALSNNSIAPACLISSKNIYFHFTTEKSHWCIVFYMSIK